MIRILITTVAAALMFFSVLTAEPDAMLKTTRAASVDRIGEQIKWQLISSGGVDGSSTRLSIQGSVGQTAIGSGSSQSFGLHNGYWQDFMSGGGGCCMGAIRGNVEYDPGDIIDISDLVYLVDYMFLSGPAPICIAEADMNGDLVIDISDLVWLIDYMFTGGVAPVDCAPI